MAGTDDNIHTSLSDKDINSQQACLELLRSDIACVIVQIKELMSNTENYDLVTRLAKNMEATFAEFMAIQSSYHMTLTDDTDKERLMILQQAVVIETSVMREKIQSWLSRTPKEIEDQIQDTVQYMDSVSQIGKQRSTASSVVSAVSVASSARLRATAERAALEAEMAAEKKRQALEEEEFRLKHRRRQLELETQMAKVAAMERTFAEACGESPIANATTYNGDIRAPRRQNTGMPSPIMENTQTTNLVTQMMNNSFLQQQSLVEALQLPKTELMTFDGDPIKYWAFIRAFENAVDKDSVSDGAKLARLQQYCTGPAKRLVQCCLVKEPSEGYPLARKLLKERFGNEYDIAEAWINKITNRPDIRDNKALLDYSDDLRICRETLDTMGKLGELNNSKSLSQIVEKLPWDLRKVWLRKVHHIKSVVGRAPSIDDVMQFVSTSAQQANDPVFGKLVSKDHNDKPRKDFKPKDKAKPKQRASFNVQAESTPPTKSTSGMYQTSVPVSTTASSGVNKPLRPCMYCGQRHGLFGCDSWKALKVGDRLNFVLNRRLCVNCLQPGHHTRDCTRNAVCTVPGCGLKHTKFLHLTRSENAPTATNVNPEVRWNQSINNAMSTGVETVQTSAPANVSCSTTGAGAGKVALPVVPVKVRGITGARDFVTTYALLDSGSTQTFCSEELVKKLGLRGKHETLRLTTLDNYDTLSDTHVVKLEVTDVNDENLVVMPHVLTRPRLHVSVKGFAQNDLDKWPHLNDITLPDISPKEVHLLIGQDNPSALIPKEVREGGVGVPYATRTILGWTLNGPIDAGPLNHMTSLFIDTDTSLQRQVEKFWKLDDTGGNESSMSISDRKVITAWEQSLHQDGGHYSMDIPFKTRPPFLPDNKPVAEHRLRLLGRRLTRDVDLKKKYITGIAELMTKGYAEEVPQRELDRADGAVWYLPHHSVFHPRKPGKIRIVFDCAAKYHGISLNDKVHQGPDLTNKLVGVLLCFRQETIGLMADIEGMFNQVLVNTPDRDVLRFLWWNNNDMDEAPTTYRMRSHLFGGVWSPSCANFALKRTAKDNMHRFDAETITTIDKDLYVDDCLKSVATEQEAVELVRQLREALSLGGFRITKWISNSRKVLRSIPETERAKEVPSLDFDDEILPAERALGVLWDVESDTFSFNVNVKDKPPTRRGMLSTVSSVYDPLGFVSPFVLTAKILFQQLCRMKIGWDDPIPPDIKDQWTRWMADLPLLQKLSVPRCVKLSTFDNVISAQLHHFSDASEKGYGAVTYLRLRDTSSFVHCTLLMAKAKLAPLKTTTIPRLELCAAVTSIKLDEMIRDSLTLSLQESVYWSDSMIVLQYLRNEDKRFQTFVANRVARILEHSTPQQWRHIDSDSNVGDDVSRGLTATQLVESDRWIPGPQFLYQEEDAWPPQPNFDEMTLSNDLEIKTTTQVYKAETIEGTHNVVDTLLEAFSSWYRLKRAVAWILRVKTLLLARVRKADKDLKSSPQLTVEDIQAAEKEIIKHVQKTSFTDTLLKSGGYRKLVPTKTSDGIIQVGGRLANATLSVNAKHPWILPMKHPVTTLIVRHYHKMTSHSGTERTLAEIRQRYWIIKGRAAVNSVVHTCIPCRKQRAPTMTQQMADLPKDRVTPGLAPFSMVGVDFFGPFLVKRGRSDHKRYGCIFTCLTTRAVHLEVCHSMETDSFINALQRFISRRGKPLEIRSDNGTNFVGGMRELRQAIRDWNQDKIDKFLCQKEIQWIFNPPAASHFGGVWERQIRTVRSILNTLLRQQTLDDESLSTFMCIAEGIINGRPITKLSDDPHDPMPLTPNHLLLLRSGPQLPPGNFVKQDIYKRRWRQVEYMADVFWKRCFKKGKNGSTHTEMYVQAISCL